jgi:serine/threonine protein kinase
MSNGSSQSLPSHGQALSPGTQLEEFIIERVLGSGGFGITYLARDGRLGRRVVIKENLPVQFCWREQSSLTVRPRNTDGEDADNFQYTLDSFEREATTLASLDHSGIVKVLRSFEANGTAYFVMPFVEGTALDEVIRNRREKGQEFAEEEIWAMLSKVLDALAYLHERGIYHRDIKPGNILITSTGEPVLIDFGAARQRLSERSLTVIESAGYTPFEQLQTRGKVGPWSDLYALAATFYKIITGETPAKAADRVMDDPLVPLAQRAEFEGRYSPGLLESIDQALAPNAGNRFQTSEAWKAWAWGIPNQASSHSVHSTPEPFLDESATMVRRPRRAGSDSPSASKQGVPPAQTHIVESPQTSPPSPPPQAMSPVPRAVIPAGKASVGAGPKPAPPTHRPLPAPRKGSRSPVLIFSFAAILMMVGVGWWWFGVRVPVPFVVAPSQQAAQPPAAVVLQPGARDAIPEPDGPETQAKMKIEKERSEEEARRNLPIQVPPELLLPLRHNVGQATIELSNSLLHRV